MSQLPVMLVWVQDGGVGRYDYLVDENDADVEAIVVPPDVEEPPPGRYLRLSDDRSEIMTPHEFRPVLLRHTHSALETYCIVPFDDPDDQVALAHEVASKVQEAVEIETARGAVPIGPTTTYVTASPEGGYVMHGVCVLARQEAGLR